MKKLKITLLLGLMIAALAGCGNNESGDTSDTAAAVVTEQPGEDTVSSDEVTVSEDQAATTDDATVSDQSTSEEIVSDESDNDEVTEATDESTESEESDEDESMGNGEHHDEIASLASQRDEILSGTDSVSEINNAHDINKQITELNSYDFSGMKITCLGDSITYGRGGEINEYGNPISYVDYLRDILGCEVVNVGLPGSTIGNYGSDTSFLYRVDLIPSDSDIIIVFGGVNDYLCGNSVFGAEGVDDGNYNDAVNDMFTAIREKCPDAEMFVVLTYSNQLEDDPVCAGTYEFDRWLDVQRCLSNKYDFHKIEMYRNGFMNSRIPEIQQTFFFDNVHPNDSGYRVIARYIAAKIVEVYN